MDKNATLRFVFEPDGYPDVDLEFRCDRDLTYDELFDFFKRFAVAAGYCPDEE